MDPELSSLSINLKVCVLPFVKLVTLRYGHRVYLCASCDPYFKIKRDFHGMQDHPFEFPFLYQYMCTIQNTYKQTRLLRHVSLLLYVFDVVQLSV